MRIFPKNRARSLLSIYGPLTSCKISKKYNEPILKIYKSSFFPTALPAHFCSFLPNLGLNDGHAQARMSKHVTKLISLHSFHTKNISSKFHQNLMNQIRDILKTVYFGTKYGLIWAEMMGQAKMGEYMTKLISLHSFHTKNISSKFHQNLMNQIRYILKTVYFGTKYGLIWA